MTPRAISLIGCGLLILVLVALSIVDAIRERHPRFPRRQRKELRGMK